MSERVVDLMAALEASVKAARDAARRLPCMDCGEDTASTALGEYYMVSEAIWTDAGGRVGDGELTGEYLCIGCLEARLDRRLTRDDFIDAPVNRDPGRRRSTRLANRLQRAAS